MLPSAVGDHHQADGGQHNSLRQRRGVVVREACRRKLSCSFAPRFARSIAASAERRVRPSRLLASAFHPTPPRPTPPRNPLAQTAPLATQGSQFCLQEGLTDLFQHVGYLADFFPPQAAQRPADAAVIGPSWLLPSFDNRLVLVRRVSGQTDVPQEPQSGQNAHQKFRTLVWGVCR